MREIDIFCRRLPSAADLPLPFYATEGAAGMDLVAAVDQPVILKPAERTLIPTGLVMAVPYGYELQIRPRSGLALKYGITVPNSPGTIDSDYRGEIKVILMNAGSEDFEIKRGDRIAQAVLAAVLRGKIHEINDLGQETARGSGGFGSTGV